MPPGNLILRVEYGSGREAHKIHYPFGRSHQQVETSRKFVKEDENNIPIMNGLKDEYTIKRRMLEGEAEKPSSEHTE